MRHVVIVTLDGLRRDFLSEANTPHLVRASRRAEFFSDYRTVFPSATRVVSASLATGCFPARHELQGNSLALLEDGRLIPHDAGHPDFLQHKRRVTGRSLGCPTLAERVRNTGGAIVFSNVSPGAAYAHDPDGHGFVYHRAGSFGPGRVPVSEDDALRVTPDIAGDRVMTDRFASEVIARRRPALAVLWLGEPDITQHVVPLGSPEHLEVLRAADSNVQRVVEAVDRERGDGRDILLLIGSDHGHQTVTGVVDIEAELIKAGLKEGAGSGDVVSVSNGTSAFIYLHPEQADHCLALKDFLDSRPWADRVVSADELGTVGQAALNGLAFAVSMRSGDEPNGFGVRGTSLVAKPSAGKPDRLGCGQHGGLATYEQSPFLMIDGNGFVAGATRPEPACIVDLAPTVLRHLGLGTDGMDGRPLQLSATFNAQETSDGYTNPVHLAPTTARR